MTYFEFLDNIIENFRVSKMIEIVKTLMRTLAESIN